jgi:hypothetical protein
MIKDVKVESATAMAWFGGMCTLESFNNNIVGSWIFIKIHAY